MGKDLGNKYGHKLLDTAQQSTTDAIKTVLKRAIQTRAEATGDLISNKIANKIISVSKIVTTKRFKRIIFNRVAVKNRWKWNKDSKRNIHISRKKTKHYWWVKISVII